MNVVLIPFLLAANVPGAESWVHGPEYVFQANLTYLLSTDFMSDPFDGKDVGALMRCRPKSEDSLVCTFTDVEIAPMHTEKILQPALPYPFLIKFNQRGVEGIGFPMEWKNIDTKSINAFRSFVKELSVGVDLNKHVDDLSSFVEQEEIVLGECPTLFEVRHFHTFPSRMVNSAGKKRPYTLEMLKLFKLEVTSNVAIQKRTEHRKCTNLEDSSYMSHGVDVKIGRSIMKMQFNIGGEFKSKTEMHVKVGKPSGPRDTILQDITSLELLDIVQAQNEWPTYSYENFVGLRYTSGEEQNCIL